MKLIYRGTTYDYNPANVTARRPFQHTRTRDSAYELIYRGLDWVKVDELKGWDTCDRISNIWWGVDDLATGQSIYQVSEAEFRA
jgi:hypothetical protein